MEPERLYVVQPEEGHAIVLQKDSEVLIIENRDMSQTDSRAIRQDVQMAVKKEIGGC